MSALQKKIDQVKTVLAEAVRDYSPVTFANSLGAGVVCSVVTASISVFLLVDGGFYHLRRCWEGCTGQKSSLCRSPSSEAPQPTHPRPWQ